MTDPRLRLGSGARAVEELLLEDLDRLLPEGPEGLRQAPVRIVVPSRALRLHLQGRLARARGAVLGVSLQSLRGLALTVIDAAGRRPRAGAALLLPLARRAAAEEPSLASMLALEGGARALAGAVTDLLDAGLDATNAEAAVECLEEAALGAAGERGAALIRCAARVVGEFEGLDLASPASVLREAADLIVTRGDELLPARAILVHGFADATGAATELLHALLRQAGALLYLDRPPDPARPERSEEGNGFALRFAERTLAGSSQVQPQRRCEASSLELLRAPGPRAEAAAIAVRLQAWIEAGAEPEGLAVLVRHPVRQLPALRAELARAGVPFSCGQAGGPPGSLTRRIEALRRVLSAGDRVGIESWMDAIAKLSPEMRSDRLSAMRVLGVSRLRDLVALEGRLPALVDETGMIKLTQRRGLSLSAGGGEEESEGEGGSEGEDGDERAIAPFRKVPAAAIEAEIARARAGLSHLAARPSRAPGSRHVAALRALLTGPLGWSEDKEDERALLDALDALAASLPQEFELDREDADALFEDALLGLGSHPSGGRGGGVQLLGVMEARALTFDRLVLAGLNRDSFPRVVREDPLLPDALRRALNAGGTGVLPDLSEKSAGVDEERFLFAQALSAAPQILLSWCSSDEDGKPRPASPLLERLRLERLRAEDGELEEPPLAAHRHDPPTGERAEARPALDHAVLAGLHGNRGAAREALPAVMREALVAAGASGDAALIAAARGRLLEEFDAAPQSQAGMRLGPWFGFVGGLRESADPRHEALAVTRVEEIARCGWKSFVGRVLRVAASPDPSGTLPSLSPLFLGEVVHQVLEVATRRQLDDRPRATLAEALAAGPVKVELPTAERLRPLFEETVERLTSDAGLPLGAFASVVVERAMELFEVARLLDWSEGEVEVLGAEVAGEAEVLLPGGGRRSIAFTADRVDLVGGRLRLVDYKTGKPPGHQRGASFRRAAHLRRVSEGLSLQPSAYALAGGEASEGRLLFLKQGLAEDARLFPVGASELDFSARFASVVATVDAAFTKGAFLPRLDDGAGKEPITCKWCDVAEACIRGDSGARMRLWNWAKQSEEARAKGLSLDSGPLSAALDLFAIKARAEEASS